MFKVTVSYGATELESDLNSMADKGYQLISIMPDGTITGIVKAHYTTVWKKTNATEK
jgi:hypothetical protein